jgi:hypothetical protein
MAGSSKMTLAERAALEGDPKPMANCEASRLRSSLRR